MTRNKTFLFILACFMVPVLGRTEEAPEKRSEEQKSASAELLRPRLMDAAFVVESSEGNIDDSMDRVLGRIDRGYASDGQSYKSENHYGASPFGRQDIFDNAEKHDF